jgi:hypothetical protein
VTNSFYKINLPQQAIDYYNQKADELLLKLEPYKESSSLDSAQSSKSHLFSQTIDVKDIDNLSISTVDGFGNIKSKYFDTATGQVGLCGENYQKCRVIIEKLSNTKELRELVSYKFIHDSIFTWFSEKYNGSIKQDIQFLSYLSKRISEVINKYKIAIPISFLIIEKPFKIGNIVFDFLRTDLFDKYEKKSLEGVTDENEINAIKQGIIKIRKKYQGKTCATIKLEAERNKAIEIAKNETDISLAVLQFFSPAALIPESTNYISRMGQISVLESHVFLFEGELPVIMAYFDDNRYPFWHLGEKELSKLEEFGINMFSNLISRKNLSKFEETCLTSIRYYSKAISFRKFPDRLVFLIVSIETLLLMDKNEPIQENVTRRLAILTKSLAQQQVNVISTLSKAYQRRSSYLHHGEIISDMNMLKDLQLIIWTAIERAVHFTSKFITKSEFINYLEEKISSG